MRVVDACKQHPIMSIVQAIVVALLVWVGTTIVNMSEKVAGLSSQVQALEKQVGRIQNSEDRRVAEETRGHPSRR